MSLNVPPAVIDAAAHTEIDDTTFAAVVRDSLPYAWQVITTVVGDLATDPHAEYTEHAVPPPDQAARGQLLRALASDAIRGSLERHFGVQLAFQNCHRVAAFRPDAVTGEAYRPVVSPPG